MSTAPADGPGAFADHLEALTPLERAYYKAAADGNTALAELLEAEVDAAEQERENRLNAPGAVLNAALWYASQGVAVFPCRPGEKRPATMSGFHDATTDLAKIRKWWHDNPAANLAYPTGYQFDVIDVDGRPGYESIGTMRERGLIPEVIGRARTPRGVHLYIKPTGDGNTTSLLPGIDYRGDGGYVLAPPSRLTEGDTVKTAGAYRWINPLQLETKAQP